jgi:hypothetical protein
MSSHRASLSGNVLKIAGYQHQADAVLSQDNPVSTTLYTVLDTTRNVRIIDIAANITWAVTQPSPLEVVVTIDGQTIVFGQINPVSATQYSPNPDAALAGANQTLATTNFMPYRAFLLEGRSVKIQVRVTWAVTQPTPLECRVKYAKIP